MCDILNAPARYDGQTVIIHSEVFTTMYFPWTGLKDDRCHRLLVVAGRPSTPACEEEEQYFVEIFSVSGMDEWQRRPLEFVHVRPNQDPSVVIAVFKCSDVTFEPSK